MYYKTPTKMMFWVTHDGIDYLLLLNKTFMLLLKVNVIEIVQNKIISKILLENLNLYSRVSFNVYILPSSVSIYSYWEKINKNVVWGSYGGLMMVLRGSYAGLVELYVVKYGIYSISLVKIFFVFLYQIKTLDHIF